MNIDRFKFSLLVWIAVYPVVTALSFASGALLPDAPFALRTLVLSGIMVPVMVFAIIPTILQRFGPWLSNARETSDASAEYERKLDAWFEEMAACPN